MRTTRCVTQTGRRSESTLRSTARFAGHGFAAAYTPRGGASLNVPGFLVKQFYVSGSLRNTDSGFALQARNALGDGTLIGVRRLAVDGSEIPAEALTAVRQSDSAVFRASDVSQQHPIRVHQGDRVTLEVRGWRLRPGEHRLEVELVELNLGLLRLSVKDRLR